MASRPKKIRVGLIFGGQSGEHEVSLQSAKSIHEALDKKKYEVILIGIDKKGVWHLCDPSNYLINSENPSQIKLNEKNPPVLLVRNLNEKPGSAHLVSPKDGSAISKVDVFFPIIHGTYGEDGKLQGLLEMIEAPYVGAGVLGSAVGMDKDIMKRLLQEAELPVGKFISLRFGEASNDILEEATKKLKLPLFVKPANMGSSVGVSKVRDLKELKKAAKEAFVYDKKIILEEFVAGREIEVAVIGNEKPKASLPGEILPTHDFYSYEAKYIDDQGAKTIIPAKLTKEAEAEVQRLAIQAFRVLECSGMGRVDFFYTTKGKFVVNEINTLPGFTKISMYPKLWAASGLTYARLLDQLINLALAKKHTQK